MEFPVNEIIAGFCSVSFLLGLISAIFFYLVYSGMFANIEVSMETKHVMNDAKVVAYKRCTGAYLLRLRELANVRKMAPYSDTIGIYYDHPTSVPVYRCRYIVGVIVQKCGDKMTLEELVSRLEAEDFRFFLIPGSNPVEVDIDSDQPLQQALMEAVPMISSVLPSRTFLSPILYSCRVFAAMRRYIRLQLIPFVEKPFIEYYQISPKTVHFLVPTHGNFTRYYIPEFRADRKKGQVGAKTYRELAKKENLEMEQQDIQTTSV
ncbi:testis-expressed protein 264-like isoform X2 [Convolutriloba macropyga]|uniref:testis-expressed protein 264-like isoform X2 n=1 Tax=Convolutriloba macropyga TaxID=536237 RepID=UPI003F51CBF7